MNGFVLSLKSKLSFLDNKLEENLAYIYKLTNKINGKIYIGQTNFTVEKRFREHCADSAKPQLHHRELYKDLFTFGSDSFEVEILEECLKECIDERESYWICHHRSCEFGYNTALGGKGSHFWVKCKKEICEAYLSGVGLVKLSKIYKHDLNTLKRVLQENSIEILPWGKATSLARSKPVVKLDKKTGKELQRYSSSCVAEKSICGRNTGHVSDVCRGRRKSAYGYLWSYIE